MSRSTHSIHSVAAAVLLLALLAGAAHAWTFEMQNMAFPPYQHEGYRPMPHWRVGVWSKDSVPGKVSTKDLQPEVQINVRIRRSQRPYAQFFMYDVNYVESEVYGTSPDAHPCMNAGQGTGVAQAPRLGNAVIVTGFNDIPNPNGGDEDLIRIEAHAPIQDTGLYAFTFLTCRWVWQNPANPSEISETEPRNQSGWVQVLDDGTDTTIVDGFVKVVNPYGQLPGQAYGFLPFYAIVFVILFFNTLVLGIGMACKGRYAIVSYHWGMLVTTFITFFACIFFVAYLAEINEKDEDKTGVAIAAYFFQRIRDGWIRVYAFMFGLGLGIVRYALTFREKAMCGVYLFAYVLLGVMHIIIAESDEREILGLASVARLRPGHMHVAIVVLDVLINAVAVIALIYTARQTVKQLEPTSPRRSLYFITLFTAGTYAIIGFLNAAANVINGELHDRPYESQWKAWWLTASLMDGVFVICVVVLTMVWFPRQATTNMPAQGFQDRTNYAGMWQNGGGGQPGAARAAGFTQIGGAQQVDYGDDGNEMHEGGYEMESRHASPQQPAQAPATTDGSAAYPSQRPYPGAGSPNTGRGNVAYDV